MRFIEFKEKQKEKKEKDKDNDKRQKFLNIVKENISENLKICKQSHTTFPNERDKDNPNNIDNLKPIDNSVNSKMFNDSIRKNSNFSKPSLNANNINQLSKNLSINNIEKLNTNHLNK